jgi:hypothetical protein
MRVGGDGCVLGSETNTNDERGGERGYRPRLLLPGL